MYPIYSLNYRFFIFISVQATYYKNAKFRVINQIAYLDSRIPKFLGIGVENLQLACIHAD